MPVNILPFTTDEETEIHSYFEVECDICNSISGEIRDICENHPSMLRYLHTFPFSKFGFPQYYKTLPKKLGDSKEPNVIYPVSDKVFIHILADYKESRHNYIPIEPTFGLELDALMEQIEKICIEHGEMLPEFDEDGNKGEQLLNYIDLVTEVVTHKKPLVIEEEKPGKLSKKKTKKKKFVKAEVTPVEIEGIKYIFLRDKIGVGAIEPMILDSYTEDISCSGMGQIYIEHKVFKSLKSIITFETLEDLDIFVMRLAEQARKQVSLHSPISDATLPNGARINIVYGSDVSKRGSNFTIRQFSAKPISIFGLIEAGTLNYQMLAYLALTIGNGMNTFVAGETASGKTTLLNAITTFFHPLSKVITIEDTPELQVPHDNWIREVVSTSKSESSGCDITMFDLLKAALRQRPNWILVGEIRGEEGNIAFQAMQTGHSVMATFHAASVEKLIQRITSHPISVSKTYIDNLNVVVIMSAVKLPNGKVGRRVLAIGEIVGYDPSIDAFDVIETFHWDPDVDKFAFPGYMTSHILEQKIAPRLGIPKSKRLKVYADLERKAKILEKLHKEQKVTDFYELLKVLGKAQSEGIF
jgi:flagellar protein FlaI